MKKLMHKGYIVGISIVDESIILDEYWVSYKWDDPYKLPIYVIPNGGSRGGLRWDTTNPPKNNFFIGWILVQVYY
jgi:hypothetical protein